MSSQATTTVIRCSSAGVSSRVEVLDRHGPLIRRRLRDRVGAARWGPGRFRTAFTTTAVEEERIERDAGGGWRTADQAASAM